MSFAYASWIIPYAAYVLPNSQMDSIVKWIILILDMLFSIVKWCFVCWIQPFALVAVYWPYARA